MPAAQRHAAPPQPHTFKLTQVHHRPLVPVVALRAPRIVGVLLGVLQAAAAAVPARAERVGRLGRVDDFVLDGAVFGDAAEALT